MTVNYETILVNSMFALVVNILYKCGKAVTYPSENMRGMTKKRTEMFMKIFMISIVLFVGMEIYCNWGWHCISH